MNLSIESDEDFIRCIHPVRATVVFLKTTDWKTQLYGIDPTGHGEHWADWSWWPPPIFLQRDYIKVPYFSSISRACVTE